MTLRHGMSISVQGAGSASGSRIHHGLRALAVVGLAALLIQIVTPKLEADQLRAAVLRVSDAPSGFSHPHLRMYTHFKARLEVATRVGGVRSRSMSACALPRSFTRYGWSGGLIEAFDVSRSPMTLELCASVFKTPTDAHAAYLDSPRATLNPLLVFHQLKRLTIHGIGDESMAVGGLAATCNCGGMRATQEYGMILRHGATVLDLAYVGPLSFISREFVHLGMKIDARLRCHVRQDAQAISILDRSLVQ